MTGTRKLAITAVLFGAALALVAVAAAIKSAGPLFATWVPLLLVPWVLSRPERGRIAEEVDDGAEAPGEARSATRDDDDEAGPAS